MTFLRSVVFTAIASFYSTFALAQAPCQWNYSFDANGNALATYCGQVSLPTPTNLPNPLTIGGNAMTFPSVNSLIPAGLTKRNINAASTTYTAAQSYQEVVRYNSGAPMVDTLPGTSPGILTAGTTITIFNSDNSLLKINVGSGGVIENEYGYVLIGNGQSVTIYSDGTYYWPISAPTRAKLMQNTTLYVNPSTGSDTDTTNGGGMTSTTPFASVQHAIYYAYTNLDLNGDAGYVLTFQCAIGACASTTVSFNGPFVGQSYYPGQVLFQGSTGTPDNTTLATSSGDCVDLQNGAYVWIQGFKLTCNNSAIHVAAHSHLFYEAIDFAAVGGSHIAAVGAGSQVDIEGSYTISGAPTAAHWSAQNGAVINALVSSIITVSGTPAWGEQFASCQAATIVIDNTQLSFFGSATGQRYYTDNCFIGGSTLTATFFPGNAVGILENGGVYGDGYTIGDGVINGVRFVPGLVTTGIIQSEQITPSATNLIGQGGTSATSYSDLFDASGAASIILGGGGNSPDNTNYHKQTSHVFQDRSGTSQATINDNGVGTIGASILNTTEYFPGVLFTRAIGVNFNSIADTALSITLPKGFTRYLISSVRITNASASLTTAKFGVFPTTGGGGTAIVASGTAITVSTASDATVNNMQQTSSINGTAMSYLVANTPTIYFRVTTVQGSAATADIDLFIFCLP